MPAAMREVIDRAEAASLARMDLGRVLFGPQLGLAQDRAKFKTACCSRRAGKTGGVAAKLLRVAHDKPGCVALYLTLDRTDAKTILWERVKELNSEFGCHGKVNESELSLRLPNGSLVLLAGGGDEKKIKKRRGIPIGICVIDEAQNFPQSLKTLVDEVIVPALMDYDGELWLTGTPSPVPVGFFHEATQSKAWSHHAWTAFENPWIEKKSGKTARQHLDAELKRRGVTEDDPGIQREWFGRWAYDPNALVFRYDPARNGRVVALTGEWETVVGVDLGFDDADAIAVLGFASGKPEAHLLEEWTGTKQTITQLAERLAKVIERHKPISVVMDTGGLGKKIAEEIQKRHGLPIKAADKQRKIEFIELLNDAMRSARFFAPAGGRFAQDCMLVEWDREKSTNDKRIISDRYHSDICFIAGTMVQTAMGPAPIETLLPGERVWTREGLRPVGGVMCIGYKPVCTVYLDNGTSLTGTHDHRVWTSNREWVSLSQLTASDTVVEWEAWKHAHSRDVPSRYSPLVCAEGTTTRSNWGDRLRRFRRAAYGGLLRRASGLARLGGAGPALRKKATGDIFSTAADTCIEPFGRRGTSSECRAASMSTTSMETGTTITRATSNSSGPESTSAATSRTPPSSGAQQNGLRHTDTSLPNGTALRPASGGIPGTPKVKRVIQDAGVARVYALGVHDVHEFFANGLLVANCDAVLYAYRESLHWLHEPVPDESVVGSSAWQDEQAQAMRAEAEARAQERLEYQRQVDEWG